MGYPSVDQLQNMLAAEVFGYATDKKKASGRALGTLVEVVTFYTACAWGFRDWIAIERSVPEFAHPVISHNVEFSFHPIIGARAIKIKPLVLPLTSAKILKVDQSRFEDHTAKSRQLLTTHLVMTNAAIIAHGKGRFTTAHVEQLDKASCTIAISDLLDAPFAIFECKRVGVEEGMRKGPQTIEKAKQGAYVARSVSSLQRVRLADGKLRGVLAVGNGSYRIGEYGALLKEMIASNDADWLRHFVLTVGVVSNHGNWFTATNQNKELRVLSNSYDWLLFLTDAGLCQFIEKLLVKPVRALEPARDAFLSSYCGESKGNSFTKVRIHAEADAALKRYFQEHEEEVESWFNVIAPAGGKVDHLQASLKELSAKDWARIRAT